MLATKAACGWAEMPDLILVGHSLGGAVVVDVARGGALGKAVQGYAVLDVVEGTGWAEIVKFPPLPLSCLIPERKRMREREKEREDRKSVV